jgi:hypothetical protein
MSQLGGILKTVVSRRGSGLSPESAASRRGSGLSPETCDYGGPGSLREWADECVLDHLLTFGCTLIATRVGPLTRIIDTTTVMLLII